MFMCCCSPNCVIATDTFATDLSAFSTTGSPTVSAGSLVLNSGDGVVFTAAASSVNDAVRIYGTVDTSDDPATLRLEVAWSDASNNLYGEIDVDTTVWTIKVGRRLAGSDTDYTTALTIDAPTLPAVACLSWEPGEVQTPESFILGDLDGTVVTHTSWTNPTNILTDNGSEATYNFGAVGVSNFINVFGFPVAVPPGSTIDGIEVGIEARRSPSIGTALEFDTVRLLGDWAYGGGVSDNLAAATSISGTSTLYGFGGPTNTWGITDLSWEHLNAGFTVQIALELTTGPTGGQGLIDHAYIAIYYTTPERQPGRLRLSIDGTCVTEYAAESPAAGLRAGVRSTGGDWDLTDLSYEYLLSASRPTCGICTCTTGDDDAEPCDCCDPDFPPASAYVLDFGAGGLTDDECGFCDEIAGEIELTAAASCLWVYSDPVTCNPPSFDCNPSSLEYHLSLVDDGGGGCKWRATINLLALQDPADSCGELFAVYESASIASDEDCQTVPATLNLVASGNSYCGGSWPDPITLEAV